MNIGVEFLIILITELAIPALMAAVNALMCVIDLFQPSTWDAQFECSTLIASNSNAHTAHSPSRVHPLEHGIAHRLGGKLAVPIGWKPLLHRNELVVWRKANHLLLIGKLSRGCFPRSPVASNIS